MSVRRKEWKNLKVMENMKTTRKKEPHKEDFQEKSQGFDESLTESNIRSDRN